MLDAFLLSLRLRITYRINGILYWLKRVPLLKKLLPGNIYDAGWLKSLALVLAVLAEFFTFFLGKAAYVLVFLVPSTAYFSMQRGADPGGTFLHTYLLLALVGAVINNSLLENGEHTYYAVFLLRMDARRYALSAYLYSLFKAAAGFAGMLALTFLAGRALLPELSVSPWWIVLLPAFTVSVKILFSALNIWSFRHREKLLNDRSLFLVIPLLLLAYGLPYLRLTLPVPAAYALTALCAALAVPAWLMLWRSRDYRRIYQANPYTQMTGETINQAVQEGYQSKLELSEGDSSGKAGCAYLNDLFVRRHRKMLTRSALRMTAVLAVLAAAAAVICLLDRDAASFVNGRLMGALPPFLFVMYLINRGQTITQLYFFNCDHSLLAFRFFRRPRVILDLFRQRLRTVVLINLLPAAVIALALPLLLFLTGGTPQPLDYAVLFVSILAMSAFFSVHYLVLYYLLQPYTAGLETKSPAYSIIAGATYLVCYFGSRLDLGGSALLFGVVLILFCLLYIAAALLLAYKLAPKTFKLRL